MNRKTEVYDKSGRRRAIFREKLSCHSVRDTESMDSRMRENDKIEDNS